jgi:diguanylate cyclase (GGDEF)-like protein
VCPALQSLAATYRLATVADVRRYENETLNTPARSFRHRADSGNTCTLPNGVPLEVAGRMRTRFIHPVISLPLAFPLMCAVLLFQNARDRLPLTLAWLRLELGAQAAHYVCLLLSTSLLFALLGRAIDRHERRLLTCALTDPATALPTRRLFEERLSAEIDCAIRLHTEAALLFVDLDKLKPVNDRFGHAAGDQALRQVADCLRKSCRSRDLAARWGGDEFVVLLPGTSAEQARTLADRIRGALAERTALEAAPSDRVTVSIGVSDLAHAGSRDPEALVGSADRALALAKGLGRDRVIVASSTAHPTTNREITANVHA